jgi:hypothetical protein
MGALRAAELDIFGMVGIGKIYESYKAGRYAPFTDPFEDDDEVAVHHGPAETACVPISCAMVDIRETLALAEAANIIDRGARDTLAATLKQLHFPERSLAQLERAAATLPRSQAGALVAWLRAGHSVSQKRRDAETLLHHLAADRGPPPPGFAFERAQVWERFRVNSDAAAVAAAARAAE